MPITKNRFEEAIEIKKGHIEEILKILSKKPEICFRGGTALSMTYSIIERFSEDIDISILKSEQLNKKERENVKPYYDWIKDEISKLKWVEATEINLEKNIIEISFGNVMDTSVNKNIKLQVIVIEPPQRIRKEIEVPFNIMNPYPKADFKMKVMKPEAIFADKLMIILTRFSKNLDFSWVKVENTDARHLYDVQKLIRAGQCKIDEKYLKELIFGDVCKKEPDKASPFRNKCNPIFFDDTLTANRNRIQTKFIESKVEILQVLDKLIHPGSETIDIKKWIDEVNPYLIAILKKIKEYKNQYPNDINPTGTLKPIIEFKRPNKPKLNF